MFRFFSFIRSSIRLSVRLGFSVWLVFSLVLLFVFFLSCVHFYCLSLYVIVCVCGLATCYSTQWIVVAITFADSEIVCFTRVNGWKKNFFHCVFLCHSLVVERSRVIFRWKFTYKAAKFDLSKDNITQHEGTDAREKEKKNTKTKSESVYSKFLFDSVILWNVSSLSCFLVYGIAWAHK